MFVCVMREVGRRHLYVALYIKKRNFIKKNKFKKKTVWWSMDTHASPGKSPAEQ